MKALATLDIDGWTVVSSDEPRVSAFEIAKRAGLAAPRNIKKLVDENIEELQSHGPIPMRTQVMRIEKTGAIKGVELREVETPMLSEAQAMNLVALMRTSRASELRVALIKVFLAVRHGDIRPTSIDGTAVNSARIGDDPAAIRKLRLGVSRVKRATDYSTQRIHGFIRKTQRVSTPFAVSLHLLPHVLDALEQIECRHVALLSPKQARLLTQGSTRQLKFSEVN